MGAANAAFDAAQKTNSGSAAAFKPDPLTAVVTRNAEHLFLAIQAKPKPVTKSEIQAWQEELRLAFERCIRIHLHVPQLPQKLMLSSRIELLLMLAPHIDGFHAFNALKSSECTSYREYVEEFRKHKGKSVEEFRKHLRAALKKTVKNGFCDIKEICRALEDGAR